MSSSNGSSDNNANFKFFRLWLKNAGPKAVQIALAAGAAGVLEALTMVFINGALQNLGQEESSYRLFGLFCITITGFIITNRYALSRALRIIGAIVYDYQLRIMDRVRRASLEGYEDLDETRVYASLVENTDILIESTRFLVQCFSGFMMLVVSSLYIASMSMKALIFVVVLNVIAMSIFMARQRVIGGVMRAAKARESGFLNLVHHIMDGFKEVKVNRNRRRDIYDNHLLRENKEMRAAKIDTEIMTVNNFLFVYVFFFILMASVVFLLPEFDTLEPMVIINIVAVLLFTFGPLGRVVMAVPFFTKADLAVTSVEELESYLRSVDDMRATDPDDRLGRHKEFQRIRMEDLTFRYTDDEGHAQFSVGPVNLDIERGQTIFLVGGNGSGKSTLMKMLCGLYYPQEGSIYVDHLWVNNQNYDHYRNYFSIIFSDFHIFDRLYGIPAPATEDIDRLLDRMLLSQKTGFVDGRFTNTRLSSGQRKRLALITSYFEDKPICLFDEVAADLDPSFRKYFYEQYLQELKNMGKTVIAVSHDDRFFHLADRVVKMEAGAIVEVT